MKRILFWAFVLFVILGLSWLAQEPGTVQIDWMGYRISFPLIFGVSGLLIFAILLSFTMILLRRLWGLPTAFKQFFYQNKEKRATNAVFKAQMGLEMQDPWMLESACEDLDAWPQTKPLALYFHAMGHLYDGHISEAERTCHKLSTYDQGKMMSCWGFYNIYVKTKSTQNLLDVLSDLRAFLPKNKILSEQYARLLLEQGSAEKAYETSHDPEIKRQALRLLCAEKKEKAYEKLADMATDYQDIEPYLQFLQEKQSVRRQKKRLMSFLEHHYSRAGLLRLASLQGAKSPLELCDVFLQYTPPEKDKKSWYQDILRMCFKAEMWGKIQEGMETYRETYGEDVFYYGMLAQVYRSQNKDPHKIYQAYENALEGVHACFDSPIALSSHNKV